MTLLASIMFSLILGADPQSLAAEPSAKVTPLPAAHAHNDYLHEHPLQDALSHGFCNVEADVFVKGKRLMIAHDRSQIREDRTLRKLYLEPLQKRCNQNNGSVFVTPATFTLLIDFKSPANKTYPILMETLEDFAPMLTRHVDGEHIEGAVTVIISGNRPFRAVRSASRRLAFIDGRLTDLKKPASAWMPLVSDRWTSHFSWTGEGDLSTDDAAKLQDAVARAHRQGRRLRFWATPDDPRVWAKLTEAGVDLINTDDLAGLAAHLRDTP